jgi:hypothetical protein
MAAGFHRKRVIDFMRSGRGKIVFGLAVAIALACFLFAQNTPNAFIPAWARASFVSPADFDAIHQAWFDKNTLRPGRILNFVALFVVGYSFLSRFWAPMYRLMGWFFVPIGQATLYVFIVHVYVVLLVSSMFEFGFSIPPQGMLVNTLVHAASLAVLWLMVRYQVLFGWIPR